MLKLTNNVLVIMGLAGVVVAACILAAVLALFTPARSSTKSTATVSSVAAPTAPAAVFPTAPAVADNSDPRQTYAYRLERAKYLLQMMGDGERRAGLMLEEIARMQNEPKYAGTPVEVWVELTSLVTPESVIDTIAPAYAGHVSGEDLDALIRAFETRDSESFFTTPAGRRYNSLEPAIFREIDIRMIRWCNTTFATAMRRAKLYSGK